MLDPYIAGASPSVGLRRTYGVVNNYRGFSLIRLARDEEGIQTLDRARQAYRSIDGLKLGDMAAAAGYAESSAWQMNALKQLGQDEKARQVGEEAIKVATSVLEKRPAHMNALRARALLSSGLAGDAIDNLRPRKALALAEAAIGDWESLLKLDPGNTIAWGNLTVSTGTKSRALFSLGRPMESLEVLRSSKELEKRAGPANSTNLAGGISFHHGFLAAGEAGMGRRAEAAAALAEHYHYADLRYSFLDKDSFPRRLLPEWSVRFEVMAADRCGRLHRHARQVGCVGRAPEDAQGRERRPGARPRRCAGSGAHLSRSRELPPQGIRRRGEGDARGAGPAHEGGEALARGAARPGPSSRRGLR